MEGQGRWLRLNAQEARRRGDERQAHLQKRMELLDREAQIAALTPVILGGMVVVPAGRRGDDKRGEGQHQRQHQRGRAHNE